MKPALWKDWRCCLSSEADRHDLLILDLGSGPTVGTFVIFDVCQMGHVPWPRWRENYKKASLSDKATMTDVTSCNATVQQFQKETGR